MDVAPGGAGRNGGGNGAGRPGHHGYLSPDHVDAGIRIGKRMGQFPSATHSRSARMTASRPPTAELKVMAILRCEVRGYVDPAFFQRPVDHQQGMFENRRRPQGHIPGCQKGIGIGVDLVNLTGNPYGETIAQGEAGQRTDAAVAPDRPLPLRLHIDTQGRYGVIAQYDRSLSVHCLLSAQWFLGTR